MYSKDEIIVCLPGFTTSDTGTDKGGSGYKEGKICKVSDSNSSDIVWPREGNGIYIQATRKALDHEIQAYDEGIRSIVDLKIPEQIVNNYSIF